MPSFINLVGQRFGMLVVIERVFNEKSKRHFSPTWRCICDCGEEFLARSDALRCGKSRSCGCVDFKRRPGDTLEESFLRKIEKAESGCWLWKGTTTHGYGVFHIHKKPFLRRELAHIWSYNHFVGP